MTLRMVFFPYFQVCQSRNNITQNFKGTITQKKKKILSLNMVKRI